MAFFKKIFVISVLSFFFFYAHSHAEVVKKVEVKGNERISLETIIIFGDVVLDKDYQSSDINLLIKKKFT